MGVSNFMKKLFIYFKLKEINNLENQLSRFKKSTNKITLSISKTDFVVKISKQNNIAD